MAQPLAQRAIEHGHHIFVYNNIRTNQVVYSLTRAMKNNAALRQLPYLGKKTVPAALRKDLWLPLATISFPSPSQGLTAFRKLREYRKLHETAYPLELITQTEGKGAGMLMGKKKRGKVLMDQKANSVADIAAVLKQRENAPTPVQNAIGKRKAKKSVDAQASTEAQETTTAEGVRIRWTNVLDAQFAENWPSSVVHGALRKDRYAAAPPPARRIIGKPSAEVLEADTPKAYTQL